MSVTIADTIAQSQPEIIAERKEPTWLICYSCCCSFECYKPVEEITETEICGEEGCSGEPEAWKFHCTYGKN